MKKTIILFVLIIQLINKTQAQKQDYTWRIGYQSTTIGTTGETLNFNFTPFKIDSIVGGIETLRNSAGICDSVGNLLFYTNGQGLYNANGIQLSNGDNITGCEVRQGCNFLQMSLVLPYPSHPSQYIAFINTYTIYTINGVTHYDAYPYKYSKIDMSTSQGIGAVVEKNTVLLFDTITIGLATACKHANGRDWWVLVNRSKTNIWYRLLVSPNGVTNMGTQSVGVNTINGAGGQAVFSSDGQWYINIQPSYQRPNYDNFVNIYRFDRCTGLITHKESFSVPDTALFVGIGISPNSRFLYTSTSLSLHQLDLRANNIEGSKIKIAAWDGYRTSHNFQSLIVSQQLAPNGKIYICTSPTTDVLHVIEAPDSLGLACNFRQHAIQLPTYNSVVPNYPNFRLGALVGSGCDTIVANSEVEGIKVGMRLFPNPVHDVLSIDITLPDYNHHGKVTVVLYDVLGRLVHRHQVSDYSSIVQVDVSGFGAGVYLVGLEVDGLVFASQKVVVE
jgi:Secretion system C-terminal sorting domain